MKKTLSALTAFGGSAKPPWRDLAISLIAYGGACFLFLSLSFAAEETTPSPFTLLLDGQALFGYSRVAGDPEGDFSTQNQYLGSLGYRMDPRTLLAFAYNGSYERSNLFIAQEEGARQTNDLMSNNFSIVLNKSVTDHWNFRPSAFYNVIYVKETRDESLGDGLYDYADTGGGFENTHPWDPGTPEERILWYGFTFFHRQYPHFSSLLSEFDPNQSLENREKDFFGYKTVIGWESFLFLDLRTQLQYTFLFKDFTDKRTIDSNGIREENKREDFYHQVSAIFSKDWVGNWRWGFGSSVNVNSSDLDFYDTRNTASLGDDRFFGGYYDFVLVNLFPSIALRFQAQPGGLGPVVLAFTYNLGILYYPDRNAQDTSGNLKNEDQTDFNHSLSLELSVPLAKSLAWISRASYKEQDSNQKNEQFYKYNYELWSILSGVSAEF